MKCVCVMTNIITEITILYLLSDVIPNPRDIVFIFQNKNSVYLCTMCVQK